MRRNGTKPKHPSDATIGMDFEQAERFYAYLDGFLTGERLYNREIGNVFTAHPAGSDRYQCFHEGVEDAIEIFKSKQHSRESFELWGELTGNGISKSQFDCED